MISTRQIIIVFFSVFLLAGCQKSKPQQTVVQPPFSADSAYLFISTQVGLGARVPGSEAHRECMDYLKGRLAEYGAEVEVETGEMINYAGEKQVVYNIIGKYGSATTGRLLLAAHWDSRPWSDEEEDYDKRREPVLGANDGASGVGVLVEVARQLGMLKEQGKEANVDIVFFDCEDMGTPDFYTGKQREDTWCLGSQLWAKEHRSQKQAYRYGIVLDMVGAPGAVFPKEYVSMEYAEPYVNEVWKWASELGYSQSFLKSVCYPITDDHYYINTIAGIPCMDIIHYEQGSEKGFARFWHTTKDDMQHIDKTTLNMVGRVVMRCVEENMAK